MFLLKNLRSLKNRKLLLLFVAIFSAIVIFHRLGEMPLAGDDCYYSGIAREMARTGDFLTPRNQDGPDFHTSKPPVLFWMNAVSGKLFGFDSFGMRLPSALLGFLCVIALFFFVRGYFNIYAAFMSALALTFTQQYLYHARSAVTDGPFAAFFSLAIMCFWVARSENKNSFYYMAGLFSGLAVMTRQIPGLFIVPVILIYILISREFRIFKNPHLYGGIFVSLVVIVPWHIAMYVKYKAVFLEQYFRVALMTGISGYPVEYSGNTTLNPWYAYFEILLSNYWPWLPFFVIGIYKSIKGYLKADFGEKRIVLFMFCWALVPFLIFQAAKVKQYHYLVPLYIPFAVFTGLGFNSFSQKAKDTAAGVISGLVVILAALYIIFPIIPKTLDSREYLKNMQFVNEAREIKGDIQSVNEWFAYYSNYLWFYADKNLVKNSHEEIVEKIKSDKKYTFILSKEMYSSLRSLFDGKPLKVIKETEETILFRN